MYEAFYGFTDKPFHLTPDPNFFFASKLHNRALSYLKYGISQGEGFIVITGQIGTGKTTIANSLLAELENDEVKAIQIVTPKLNPEDLIFVTAAKLGLNTDNKSKGQVLQLIEQELARLVSSGYRALLVVDEAQNLPVESVEELRMLSNFQIDGKPLLQSFLLGQPELRELLQLPNMEQFRQRIVASCDLKPLSQPETHEYINFRLAAAAGKPVDIIANEAIESIYDFTGGTPRRINTLCDRVLLYGFLEDKTLLTAEDVATVIAEIKQESADLEPEKLVQASNPSTQQENRSEENITQQTVENESKLEDLTPPAPQFGSVKASGLPKDVMDDVTHLRNMLSEIKYTLETSIEYKLKVSRYIDNVINRKLKQLKQVSNVEDEQKELDE
ncbi:XrtA/PEP-CTERM system-associated ATPase [Catenovulum maritimum]|uniref:General secretion pathway protein GspA n=1 Tax=Catenovulum maritimum TaxID=1513271 RepID=A0A0J8GM64_9ALTE|nr:XrtA/PEP-CTERM system-associated ATPase [Catenovulum maritimum]KMT63865.1 general secretion pathway protein GspA [Catenovulum maritimum]